MMLAVTLGLVVVTALGAVAYNRSYNGGLASRAYETRLGVDVVQATFRDEVARLGWIVIDDGNPMVASSPLVTGVHQHLALAMGPVGAGRWRVTIGPTKVSYSYGQPNKVHTIRLRMDRFERQLNALDPELVRVDVG